MTGMTAFSHDVSMSCDPGLVLLRNKYGLAGHGFWCMLLEIIYHNGYYIRCTKDDELGLLTSYMGIDKDQFMEYLGGLFNYKLLDTKAYEEHTILTSKTIQERFAASLKHGKFAVIHSEYWIAPLDILSPFIDLKSIRESNFIPDSISLPSTNTITNVGFERTTNPHDEGSCNTSGLNNPASRNMNEQYYTKKTSNSTLIDLPRTSYSEDHCSCKDSTNDLDPNKGKMKLFRRSQQWNPAADKYIPLALRYLQSQQQNPSVHSKIKGHSELKNHIDESSKVVREGALTLFRFESIDNESIENIIQVLDYIVNHSFYQTIVISLNKLRSRDKENVWWYFHIKNDMEQLEINKYRNYEFTQKEVVDLVEVTRGLDRKFNFNSDFRKISSGKYKLTNWNKLDLILVNKKCLQT